eukprot:gene4579-4793_t
MARNSNSSTEFRYPKMTTLEFLRPEARPKAPLPPPGGTTAGTQYADSTAHARLTQQAHPGLSQEALAGIRRSFIERAERWL